MDQGDVSRGEDLIWPRWGLIMPANMRTGCRLASSWVVEDTVAAVDAVGGDETPTLGALAGTHPPTFHLIQTVVDDASYKAQKCRATMLALSFTLSAVDNITPNK